MPVPCLTDLLGVPFRVHGRGDGGYDCWGLCMEVYRRFGLPLEDFYYSDLRNPEAVRCGLMRKNACEKLQILEVPCILLIRINGAPVHAAAYIGEGLLIHSTENAGAVIEPLRKYKARIDGAYRILQG